MEKKLKKGDRVRYTGVDEGRSIPHLIGKVGMVTTAGIRMADVIWDDNEVAHNHYLTNLELIQSALDLTKPLRLTVGGTRDEGSCTILGEFKDGSFIIDGPSHGKIPRWIIFDRYGKFVRSEGGQGTGLVVINGPEIRTAGVVLDDGTPINVTYTDGVATAVELVK